MDFETKEDLFDYINELTNKIEALENSLTEKDESIPQEEPEEKEEINEIDSFLDKKGVNA